MLARPTTLKIYWGDNVTIEERYFPSQRKAKDYVKVNGIINYEIEPTYWDKAYDMVGREIHKGDKVEWHDPDPEGVGIVEYQVYDKPDAEMVKLSNEYGECEALPEECKVIK